EPVGDHVDGGGTEETGAPEAVGNGGPGAAVGAPPVVVGGEGARGGLLQHVGAEGGGVADEPAPADVHGARIVEDGSTTRRSSAVCLVAGERRQRDRGRRLAGCPDRPALAFRRTRAHEIRIEQRAADVERAGTAEEDGTTGSR